MLDSILKSRDITLPTKVRIVKAIVFPVVMYRSESWTIKKADCGGHKEKGATENEMAGQCSRSYQHEFDQTAGGSGRQECLACSGPWGHKESDTAKQQQFWTNISCAYDFRYIKSP
uniref:Uncharacterized protein n=1 Tax=Podarcis muralis TaxID=64176 RepID=A0A670HXR9_PODMU